MENCKREEAQLWGIYFGMRAVKHPPPFLRQAQQQLRQHLYRDQGDSPARHLSLIGGES